MDLFGFCTESWGSLQNLAARTEDCATASLGGREILASNELEKRSKHWIQQPDRAVLRERIRRGRGLVFFAFRSGRIGAAGARKTLGGIAHNGE